jgi:hypothetical protein
VPREDGHMKFWTAAGVIINAIAFFAAAAAAYVAYRQYQTGLDQERIKQTTAFISVLNSDQNRQARQQLFETLYDEMDGLARAVQKNKDSADPEQRSQLFAAMMDDMIKRKNLDDKINLLFGLYNQIGTCVVAEICDLKSATAFFLTDMSDFASWFAPHLSAKQRKFNHSYDQSGQAQGLALMQKAAPQAP